MLENPVMIPWWRYGLSRGSKKDSAEKKKCFYQPGLQVRRSSREKVSKKEVQGKKSSGASKGRSALR